MWILYDFIGDCSDGVLTPGGGAAHANSGPTYGCHNGCLTTGQVHVIAQNGGDPAVFWTEHIEGRTAMLWPMVGKKSAYIC